MTDRLPTLDGLRGLAVMGILLMNIAAFAMPEAAYSNPRAFGAEGWFDYAVWTVEFVLVDGKMRALFSALFGASMLLVLDRAEAAGLDSQRIHFRRMGWLLVIGLGHALLIWHGDILTLYALIGCLAWAFAERSGRTLLRNGIMLFAVHALIMAAFIALMRETMMAGTAPGADAEARAAWHDLNAMIGLPGAAELHAEHAVYQGSYGELLRHRVARLTPLFQLPMAGAETLAYMLLGMIGLRNGFLSGQWERRRYLRVALLGYALSLPPMIALAGWCFARDFAPIPTFFAANLAALPARPLMMVAHAALALFWLSGRQTPLRLRVIAAGRTAFTNYLATSLVMTTLFYGYGAGMYGALGRAELLIVVFAGCALMLGWSKPWLDRFRYGPLEWLWRSLAHGQRMPMRR